MKGQAARGWKSWSTKKRLLVIGSIVLVIIALAVGLGVGLGLGLGGGEEGEEEGGGQTPGGNVTTAKWQPAVGTKWQIVLLYPLNDTSVDADVYDIDLFTNDKSVVDELHSKGRKVICYFSAGSWENWRPDKDKFKSSDKGSVMDGWEDENWLDIRSANVRSIMQTRLDMAVEKGCDGVDPDNVDAYDNQGGGLKLTANDSINYMMWLANEAHGRNMSIGLKNAGKIIPSVIQNMQWSVNEQCAEYNECDTYAPFVEQGKPVFHVEYPKGEDIDNNLSVSASQKNAACDFGYGNFSTVIKNMNLDNWVQDC
ncbi:glycoside hydrolase superfamily [Aspergillus ambiguus]|uniref:endo alpha-1,4 polygalactosaminidase n=1 Tax=Aspergillus ambiguus TaxID=176160 RepID=UPI003CCDD4B0